MSNVDVVQRTAAAAALPSPLPPFESAMAAAAATATATAAGPATKPQTSHSSSSTSIGIAAGSTTTTNTAITTPINHNNSSLAAILPPPPTTPQIGVIGIKRTRNGDHREGRNSKSRTRTFNTKSMEPPVLSFYGTQPVPLPSRFGSLKKRLVAGHESALEASWGRLIAALRDEVKYIEKNGAGLIPEINFTDIDDDAKVAPFHAQLKRHGIGVVKGVVPAADASTWVEETKKYLEMKHEYKPPPAQDPTCFDFFWTPAQVRSRAHPHVLQAQRFAMSLWNTNNDDRLATRFPITYADRIRIESFSNGNLTVNGAVTAATHEDSLIAAAAATSAAQIAQVDNGSLERWEQDGYGRTGLYDAIFKGDWESYDAWDPAGRINATSDLYNGAGVCSMMRLFQGILALTVVEPGMIRLLPSPKLSTAYFLLRPFFTAKEGPPPQGAGAEAWDKYLDASNWTLEKEPSTIIHGAVPGHAQRVTAAWHPHLQLDKSLVTAPTLQVGDYIIWHPDQAYQFSNTNYRTSSRPQTSSSSGGSTTEGAPAATSEDNTSMLVYTPAAPLTQTNALYLARQRKTFLRGHPGPDFDSTGTGLGSEAPHTGRLGEKDIRGVGGEEGLQAMGLAPWNLSGSGAQKSSSSSRRHAHKHSSSSLPKEKDKKDANANANGDVDMDMDTSSRSSSRDSRSSSSSSTQAEAEVVRLANIILFPDRYDFYMPTRASSPASASASRGDRGEKERERERERDRDVRERESSDRDKDRDKATARDRDNR
ncbi:uncharacterized protein F4807DRAFT_123988 [Annulohypoxylon truncatum]|uniref:uncharacterized protein n=1 Tax=Annulohypoxylon truncatum TaxID=327061 RepID=UPI00200785AF|nr:uncharacterized protein F4807DRAFT_123988 [Annulohypoxylon truncatum]KAI1214370.1 hypothetical protein F4807DRAFT_123988 [Annulohypoxylon truncatum]